MKKFWIGLVVFILLACSTAVATVGIMAKIHKRSFRAEFKHLTQQEQTVETKDETSKDSDIVIEDETQTEGEAEEQSQEV